MELALTMQNDQVIVRGYVSHDGKQTELTATSVANQTCVTIEDGLSMRGFTTLITDVAEWLLLNPNATVDDLRHHVDTILQH